MILRLAAIQMASANRATLTNLAHAEAMVEEAAALGAQLVLLPELFSTGFEFTEAAWDYAETQGGITET